MVAISRHLGDAAKFYGLHLMPWSCLPNTVSANGLLEWLGFKFLNDTPNHLAIEKEYIAVGP